MKTVIIRFADSPTALNICNWLILKKMPFSYKPGEWVRVDVPDPILFSNWMKHELNEARLYGSVEIVGNDPLKNM